MFTRALGEIIALGAVAGWTVSALAFETAAKRIGSVPVNTIRMVMAALILILINALRGLPPWPAGITAADFMWLIASGFVGFFIGDLLLFRSYLIIGSRMAMLIMSLSPPVSALLDRLVFGTLLTPWDAAGMILTMIGVVLALSGRTPGKPPGRPPSENPGPPPEKHPEEKPGGVPVHPQQNPGENPADGETRGVPVCEAHPVPAGVLRSAGVLLAFGGALGQSGGMILAKLGMRGIDAMSATFIRSLGGIAGFLALVLLTGAAARIRAGLRSTPAMLRISIGALAGPVLGVSAVLAAMNHSPAGVVSAIIAVIPVVIILPSIHLLKDKVRTREILGAALAVTGVIVLIVT